MPHVIGLDISTSIVGFAVIDGAGSLIELDSIDLRKFKSVWKKLDAVAAFLRDKSVAFAAPASVFVEQNLSGFRPGASSAATLMALARFNGMVSAAARATFGIDPTYVDFSSARKHLGMTLTSESKCGVKTKEQIRAQASQMIDWQWRTKTLKSGPRKGQTVIDERCYDEADAWVVARAGLDGITVRSKKPKKKPKSARGKS